MLKSKLKATAKDFGPDFLWGASVSTHQVEGGQENQWTVWEHEKAAELAASAEQRLSWLPSWADIKNQAENPLNYVSGKGIDHFNKYKLDFELARGLGLNSMRSGIEWSRINPSEGGFDVKAIDHYSKYFNDMKESGLEPFVTLFHWTLPIWFAEKGGFAKSGNMVYWRDFVHTVVQNMDFTNIKYVITINEPNTYSGMSYFGGEFPPGERDFWKQLLIYWRLAKAHRVAYKIIKKKYPDIQVGFAHQCNNIIAQDTLGKYFAFIQRWYWNYGWIHLARKLDFIGFNYYFTDRRSGKKINFDIDHRAPRNDLGWHMEPSGIYNVLIELSKRYKNKPIVITENGVADEHDQYRTWWINETLNAMAKAKKRGVNLIGYIHWSLLDNFEWQFGWFPKFGLISVDRKTMKRTVKESAKKWASWIKA